MFINAEEPAATWAKVAKLKVLRKSLGEAASLLQKTVRYCFPHKTNLFIGRNDTHCLKQHSLQTTRFKAIVQATSARTPNVSSATISGWCQTEAI